MEGEKRDRASKEDERYRGASSGGYGTGGAAVDFEDLTGQKAKLEDVFPEETERSNKRPDESGEDSP